MPNSWGHMTTTKSTKDPELMLLAKYKRLAAQNKLDGTLNQRIGSRSEVRKKFLEPPNCDLARVQKNIDELYNHKEPTGLSLELFGLGDNLKRGAYQSGQNPKILRPLMFY
ncbi:uncharacterized protein MCYG_00948 [Microsporum canis CBS 113480]|uniref:Uncharacterized protein n=1 Tax=Arthroderma otae (strain ATCC MYA-4605 / CBS 113480) TaxID=554155 RepID=C5FE26_ARTOC|nr:uncharacterized protein MCYG_00948 [Microsporum canis CBS 113480]EEQ28060.1 predicted protein [Microsporum canis CBS 113480]